MRTRPYTYQETEDMFINHAVVAQKAAEPALHITQQPQDAIAAWENHCKWHLKVNGLGCDITNDEMCKHWFIMGYNAATASVR